MKTQLYVGDRPEKEKFEQVKNREVPHVKCEGGFWTSTLDDDGECAWIKWTRREKFSTHGTEVSVWRIEPEDDAEVFVIDGMDDLVELVDRYGVQEHPSLDQEDLWRKYPDWEAVSEDYDAVRLTSRGQKRTRMPTQRSDPEELKERWIREELPDLYGWDCESTLWFTWKFKNVEKHGVYDSDRRVKQ